MTDDELEADMRRLGAELRRTADQNLADTIGKRAAYRPRARLSWAVVAAAIVVVLVAAGLSLLAVHTRHRAAGPASSSPRTSTPGPPAG